MKNATDQFFAGLRVVELASVLAGPLVGSFFAELGAEVVKIENKRTSGDVTRKWKLPGEDPSSSISAYYCAANYGKDTRLYNLKDQDDYAQTAELIRTADVVILNFKTGDDRKLKLDYPTLQALKPDLIVANLTGFGDDDARPAFDVVLQAETGWMSMMGEPGRPPVKMPVALIDVLAAHHLKEAILCALIHRMRTGQGRHVVISLYEAALASLANQATNYLMAGHIPRPMGTQHPNIAPYGDLYLTKDNIYLVLAVGTDRQFATLANLLGMDATGYEQNGERVKHRNALNTLIGDRLITKTAGQWKALFDQHQVPYGLVRNMQEVLDDPLAEGAKLYEKIEDQKTVRMRTAYI